MDTFKIVLITTFIFIPIILFVNAFFIYALGIINFMKAIVWISVLAAIVAIIIECTDDEESEDE